jgi:ABC-type methionine transport system ATPase subunit
MQLAVGLAFPGTLKDESVLCYICKNYNINLNIIEASFSMSSGWAIVQLEGEDGEIEKVLDYLAGKGIKIQQIEKDL